MARDMTPVVLLERTNDPALGRLLDALGVVFERRAPAEVLQRSGSSPAALILSEEHLLDARIAGTEPAAFLAALQAHYRQILVYPFRGTPEGRRALGAWVKGGVETAPGEDAGGPYAVATSFAAAGPFAGLKVKVAESTQAGRVWVRGSPFAIDHVVAAGDGGLLVRVALPRGEVFLAASTAVFDVDAERSSNLTTAECFTALVPLVFFLRHVGAAFWRTTRPTASVIIDDLNLRPRYGFVDARALARHVDELACAVSVGFIPWNWNRTAAPIVELFRSRWPRLSLSVHGCDHLASEFSTNSATGSLAMIELSLARMRWLADRTRLPYDRVMVFPQGRFSAAAMQALRRSDFLAAVNTELIDDRAQRGVPAGELLKPAIASYAGFPLFLRRKPEAPITDFALDLLLGKPCLVVTHHDDFRRGMEPFARLVGALNTLEPALRWTNLEAIVAGTYSTRATTADHFDVRLVTGRTALASADVGAARTLRFFKTETLANEVFEVHVDGRPTRVTRSGSEIAFSAPGGTAAATTVEVHLSVPGPRHAPHPGPLRHRAKVAARRYLSEFRDNYVARSTWATAAVRVIRGSRARATTP